MLEGDSGRGWQCGPYINDLTSQIDVFPFCRSPMATFCPPYASQISIANTEAIKNGSSMPFSIGVCRKGNISVMPRVCSQRQCRTVRSSSSEEARVEITPNFEKQHKGHSFLFRTEFDGLVKVFVGAIEMKHFVHIEVQSLPQSMISHNLILFWGMFRSDSLLLQGSDSHTAKFKPEASGHPMRTPFVRDTCSPMVRLDFDHSSIPFYLSFFLQLDDAGLISRIRTHRKTNFCVPVGLGPGHPMALGASLSIDGSANFCLFSRNAKRVALCLYEGEASKPTLELELDPYVNRTGDIWHVSIVNATNYTSYGYRCKGDNSFNDRHVLLDPYAKMIRNLSSDQGESASMAKRLGYLWKEPDFDWSGDTRPRIPMEKLVIYRLNVGRFTKSESSGLASNVAGTFAGVVKKVQHLKNLGVNAILFEPVFPFDEKRGPYIPYHFFSPMSIYGGIDGSLSSVHSMKEMVKILHSHGIEVLMEVVFSHTCEVEGIAEQMILDSLHHWVTEYHVDGFCFINSSNFLQGSNGDRSSRPPLVEDIAFDPLLSETKIVSDCWSPTDMSYEHAVFPHWQRWAEMNSKFFHDVRKFLSGRGLISHLATRLCGSGDIFAASRGPAYSFNQITRNAGLTLVDLVSFSSVDLASESSWNCGAEGPTADNSVLKLRLRQVRNFLFILFVSLGVPVISMGDECGYSAGGSPLYSNRAPIDWASFRTGFSLQITKFIAFLAALRSRRSDVFQRKGFYEAESVIWHGSDGSPPKWEDPGCRFLAMELKAEKNGGLFICVNAGDLPEQVTLPESSEGSIWFRLVDTSLPYPDFLSGDSDQNSQKVEEGPSSYELKPHTCALFEAKIFK